MARRRTCWTSFAQSSSLPGGDHLLAAVRDGDGSVQGRRRGRRGTALPDGRALPARSHRPKGRAGPHFRRLRGRPAAQGPSLQPDVLLRLLDRLDGERGQRPGGEIPSVRGGRRAMRRQKGQQVGRNCGRFAFGCGPSEFRPTERDVGAERGHRLLNPLLLFGTVHLGGQQETRRRPAAGLPQTVPARPVDRHLHQPQPDGPGCGRLRVAQPVRPQPVGPPADEKL